MTATVEPCIELCCMLQRLSCKGLMGPDRTQRSFVLLETQHLLDRLGNAAVAQRQICRAGHGALCRRHPVHWGVRGRPGRWLRRGHLPGRQHARGPICCRQALTIWGLQDSLCTHDIWLRGRLSTLQMSVYCMRLGVARSCVSQLQKPSLRAGHALFVLPGPNTNKIGCLCRRTWPEGQPLPFL